MWNKREVLKLWCLFPDMRRVNIYLQSFIELQGEKGAKMCNYCCCFLCNSNFRFPEIQDFFDLGTLHYVLLHTSCVSVTVCFFFSLQVSLNCAENLRLTRPQSVTKLLTFP